MSKRRIDRTPKELPPVPKTTRIYTDGSVYYKIKHGGWGVYMIMGNGSERFFKGRHNDTTISRMEMYAMSRALDLCISFDKGEEVNIYSDSAMVVNSINKKWLDSWARSQFLGRTNSDIWIPIHERLRQLKIKGVKVVIHHIRGHQTDTSHPHVFGNHVADLLADYKN